MMQPVELHLLVVALDCPEEGSRDAQGGRAARHNCAAQGEADQHPGDTLAGEHCERGKLDKCSSELHTLNELTGHRWLSR